MEIDELLNLSFTNKMLVLAEVMREPKAEYFITLHEGQVHVEKADKKIEEGGVFQGITIIDAFRGCHGEGKTFHEINIAQLSNGYALEGYWYFLR